MRKTLIAHAVVLVLIALVAGGPALTPAPAVAQAKPVVWNLPHVAAPSYYHILNYTAFATRVKEKSGGRMEIRIHPASSLYPSHELIPALIDGRAEIGPVVSGYRTDCTNRRLVAVNNAPCALGMASHSSSSTPVSRCAASSSSRPSGSRKGRA